MEFIYKGLQGTLEHLRVTDEEVDRQLERLKDQEFPDMTPEELRQSVAETLRSYYEGRAEEELLDRLIRAAADTLDYTPTAEEIDENEKEQFASFAAQLAQRHLTVEAYCSFMNTTEEQLRADLRADAERLVKVRAAIERIVELEGIEATQDDINAACEEICRANNLSAEQLQELYDDAFAESVRFAVVSDKALKLVRAAAVITEVTL